MCVRLEREDQPKLSQSAHRPARSTPSLLFGVPHHALRPPRANQTSHIRILSALRSTPLLQLLAKQFDKARIRAEVVIRKEGEVEAHEVLELMCELLSARIALIASQKECPPDIAESVHTLIWAAPRADIDELRVVKSQLMMRYGEKFCIPAVKGDAREGCFVNSKVRARLAMCAPDDEAIKETLVGIATEFKVPFDPKEHLSSSRIGLGAKIVVPQLAPEAVPSVVVASGQQWMQQQQYQQQPGAQSLAYTAVAQQQQQQQVPPQQQQPQMQQQQLQQQQPQMFVPSGHEQHSVGVGYPTTAPGYPMGMTFLDPLSGLPMGVPVGGPQMMQPQQYPQGGGFSQGIRIADSSSPPPQPSPIKGEGDTGSLMCKPFAKL